MFNAVKLQLLLKQIEKNKKYYEAIVFFNLLYTLSALYDVSTKEFSDEIKI
jgi:hypothetical protein